MKIKMFLMITMYCCVIHAMDAPMPRTIESFDSLVSFKLSGMDSPLSLMQQQLANIVLVKNLSLKKEKLVSCILGINAIAYKPNSTLFAQACNSLVEPTVTVFSPDGSTCISCKNGEETSTTCMTFSFDGAVLVCGSDKNLYFWDTQSWKLCRTLSLDTISDAHSLAFSKSGQEIIVGGYAGENNLTIFTQRSNTYYMRRLSGHKKGAISCVGFSPDAMRAVSVSGSKLKIWDAKTTNLIHTDRGKSWSNCKVEYDHHDGWFLTGYDDLFGWWFSYDLNSKKKIIIPLRGKKLPKVKAYDRSACGNYIFLGGAQTSNIFIFNLRTKQYIHTINPRGTAISAITCSPDGKYMVCAIKESHESHLYVHQTISEENKNGLQSVYSIAGDSFDLIRRLIDEVAMKKIATLRNNTDHVIFDSIPLSLKTLLQKYVVLKESMEEHDFTLIYRSVLIPTTEDDEWTFIEK